MHAIDHDPQQLDAYEGHKTVLAVHHYFAEHYPNPIVIPEVSHSLGISLVDIEAAFDRHKGLTATQALLEYRLNRLCDQMHRDPSEALEVQIGSCGLGSGLSAVGRTDDQFVACFGIDLMSYRQQCLVAEATRQQQESSGIIHRNEENAGSALQANRLLTLFHRPG